jgi:hypothetical protein
MGQNKIIFYFMKSPIFIEKKNIILHIIIKVETIFKGSLDSISSPSVKIQMGKKVCLRCKGKTLPTIF